VKLSADPLNSDQKLLTKSATSSFKDDAILAEPIYSDICAIAEELRELLVDMQAAVEQHLDELNHRSG
jgi:hypothetical protein